MKRLYYGLFLSLVFLLLSQAVYACGGLFCQNIPVAQQVERIIFTVNGNGSMTAYVQINYVGDAPSFSWVVPVPSVPEVDVAEVSTFDELDTLTAPTFIPPRSESCFPPMPVMAASMDTMQQEGQVEVLSSGTAGPYAYDVITSPDPQALITWLTENEYQVTPEMYPLIAVYNEESMVFLAMKLQPERGVQDIQPVAMTYRSVHPMIPIRLTAVAAVPNMGVLTWIFANEPYKPFNYANPKIDDEDLRGTFFSVDGTNYQQLVDMTVDLYQGRAFVTEYAMPIKDLQGLHPQDELLAELASQYGFVSRFYGLMSPEEMTVDPVFMPSPEQGLVSNLHDLSQMNENIFWGCDPIPVDVEYDPNAVPEGF